MRNFFLFFSNKLIGGDFITFTYRHRKEILITMFFLITIISTITYFVLKEPKKKEVTPKVTFVKKKEKKKEVNEEYKVDIKGEVINPGIYSLKVNSRVIDVINMAGGLTENADTSVINLSKKITDEMVIIIYSRDQVKDFSKTKEIEEQVLTKCEDAEAELINGACIKVEKEVPSKININTATLEELMTLSGIGEAKAKDIIEYREKEQFVTIEDIKKVSGIGDSLFAKIKENITV